MTIGITLGRLIEWLQSQDPNKQITQCIGAGVSYAGYNTQLAFALVPQTTIGEMLANALAADDNAYIGYNGSLYTVDMRAACSFESQDVMANAISITEDTLMLWENQP